VQQAKDAMLRLKARLGNKMDLLHEGEKLRASRDVNKLIAAGYTPEDAADLAQQQIETEQGLKTARTNFLAAQARAIPERTKQAWGRLGETALRNEIYRTATGNAAAKEAHRQAVDPMLEELKSVERSIEYLSKLTLSTDAATVANAKSQLAQEQAHKEGILNEIWKVNAQTTPEKPTSTVPQRGGSRGSKYVAPKVSVQRLQELLGLP
jgi:hypothetical protein